MTEPGGSRSPSRGLRYVTTIIDDVQQAANFYANILGLKRVKKTVCYDDPGSYHLYYGDNAGNPGTVLSTLAWRCVEKGLVGVSEVVQTALRVPAGSLAPPGATKYPAADRSSHPSAPCRWETSSASCK
ncbi:hypothetical protein ACRQ5Q_44070 (plasmid) [Bradyrhizobium sp. PMVTL-01]|uniref:hypothetical protein n=1 Tax=Bradyrhizobium sp. PMVTL-01 TaxID=3434999 RepID=UPI003F7157CB